MELFLVDGRYELFRHYYAVPSARDKVGREVGAVRAGSIAAAKVISLLSVVVIAVAWSLPTCAAGRLRQLWNGCGASMNSVFMGMWSCRSMFFIWRRSRDAAH